MSVSIRMSRSGRKHLPFYHICVFNSRTARDGRPIENLGFFDPVTPVAENLRLNLERVKYWLEQGAKPSDTVASILRKQGLKGDLWASKPNKKRKVKEGAAKKAAPAAKAGEAKPAKKRKPRTTNSKVRAARKVK